jgi:sugar phosphate isomerase/epimerase
MINVFQKQVGRKMAIPFLLGLVMQFTLAAKGQMPIERKGDASIKISLQAYAFSKLLNDNAKGRGAGLSLSDLIDYSAKNNFDAVDLTGYYFPGYPQVPTDEYIYGLKRKAYELGVEICCTGVRNDFANPDPAKRAADVKHVKEWVDVAAKLGAPMLRIFSGTAFDGYEKKWDSIANYMAASIRECVVYAKSKGVLIGVQNHGDFLKNADETIKLVKLVDSDWFGVIVDTGYFLTADPYADMEKLMPYAVNFLAKESPFGNNSPIKIDLRKVMKIIHNSGYRGYVSIETLSPKTPKGQPENAKQKAYDPYVALPAFLKAVRAAAKEEFKQQAE